MSAFRIDDGTFQLNLGPGSVRYKAWGTDASSESIKVDSAVIHGPIIVLRYINCDGKDVRLTIPIDSMISHMAAQR